MFCEFNTMQAFLRPAREKIIRMILDIFKQSLKESLNDHLSPELAKKIYDDVFIKMSEKTGKLRDPAKAPYRNIKKRMSGHELT